MQSMLKKQLRRAFELGELELHYQPKFHLAGEALQGVEALLRWRTGAGKWIGPAIFVPLLEETGMIDDVGEWLFQRAAADAAYWRCRGHHIDRIAINVSPLQLRRPGFLDWVLSIGSSWSEWGASLELEITESAILADPQAMVAPMQTLAAANVSFALDDFGMGYSSLELLTQLPVSFLKIDRSFIGRMFTQQKVGVLVETLVQLAHKLGVQAIAEGVETAEQLHRLRTLECDIVQGHYFSPALNRDALIAYLESRAAYAPATASLPAGGSDPQPLASMGGLSRQRFPEFTTH